MPPSTRAERPGGAAELLPHDLVELASPEALVLDAAAPGWVGPSLARAPFAVVRRAARRGALVPVGVRGSSRGERLAAWLPESRAVRRLRPEDLAARRGWRGRDAPQLSALDAVEALLAAHGLAWGPAGSVGFELATGVACVGPESDVDLVVRAPTALPRVVAWRLQAALAALPVRIDAQLETPAGAVALAEYAAGAPRVVLRTLDGPRWVATPWEPARASP
jgi:phosphoribosyl-dephospho-CoA transferase